MTLGNDGTEIICYCNQITEKEITDTVKKNGITPLSKIKSHLRDTVISNCAELNPKGVCCHTEFNQVISLASQ